MPEVDKSMIEQIVEILFIQQKINASFMKLHLGTGIREDAIDNIFDETSESLTKIGDLMSRMRHSIDE